MTQLDRRSVRRSDSGRRVRDQLADHAGTQNRILTDKHELQNLLLFVDDDLRQTARAVESIEGFLVSALNLLEREDLTRDDLVELAENDQVFAELDELSDMLGSLRSKMLRIAD